MLREQHRFPDEQIICFSVALTSEKLCYPGKSQDVTRMSQECHNNVTRMSQECHEKV